MGRLRSFVFILALCTSTAALAGPGWRDTFEEAERVAAEKGLPLLLHFHADWCGPCRQMDSKVFKAASVQRALQDGLVAVKVDISARPDLRDRFGAAKIPRDIAVYQDGSVELLSVGMVPRTAYLSILRDVTARGETMALVKEADPVEVVAPEFPVTRDEQVPEETEDYEEVIGLNGFCPVMLTGRKKWVQGRNYITERYRGVLYHFSGDEEREQFLMNPDRYAPRNLGCDPVVLVNEQRAVTGRIQYGAFFDGKLYLFRSSASRNEFRREPLKYTRVQHAIKPSELTGQVFR